MAGLWASALYYRYFRDECSVHKTDSIQFLKRYLRGLTHAPRVCTATGLFDNPGGAIRCPQCTERAY